MKQAHIKRLNRNTLLIEWPDQVSTDLLDHILGKEEQLQKSIAGLVESQVVYRSLSLHFDQPVEQRQIDQIGEIIKGETGTISRQRTLWKIPVCYDREFGLDLDACAAALQLENNELIEQHTAQAYPVYGMGFLPGFLYLGDVPEKLQVGRHTQPRLKVAQGSVGLAGKQTGIYPQESPGGWQILGRTPIPLFNPTQNPPSAIQVGDAIQFYAIDRPTFALFEIQVQEGIYQPQKQPWI